MNTLTKLQLGYIAGFVDGDGAIIAQIVKKNDYVLKHQLRVTVSFIQSTVRKPFLIELNNEIGLGTVRDRNDGVSELNIVGREQVLPFLKQLEPYLRLKQKQAKLVMEICEKLPLVDNSPVKFLELCELSDQVAKLNDSKKRTNTSAMVKKAFIDDKLISE
jgi:hypothetical protein